MIVIKNKFRYLGIYKNRNEDSVFFHKLIDIATYSHVHTEFWGKRLLEESELIAIFYNCDLNGIYISPRTLDIPEDKVHLSPYAVPLRTFLETHEKL